MSNATLSLTVTLTNGGPTRAAELSMLQRGLLLAGQVVTGLGGTSTSGTVYADGGGASSDPSQVSVSYTYTPVASK